MGARSGQRGALSHRAAGSAPLSGPLSVVRAQPVDIMGRFGGGAYQVVVRYRGKVKVTPVFEIEGPPIDDRT